MSAHTPATLYTVVPAKPLDGENGTILGCDLTAIRSAPFGNLVRVCFDLDDDRMSRERALVYANHFLPVREGFRHFIFADSEHSFVVGLFPDQEGHDEVIVSEFHGVRSFSARHGGVSQPHHDRAGKGRPAAERAA